MWPSFSARWGGYFYPRPPRGGRLLSEKTIRKAYKFLSTPSARRATIADHSAYLAGAIFLSTPSARRATTPPESEGTMQAISIHALREEGDRLRRFMTA